MHGDLGFDEFWTVLDTDITSSEFKSLHTYLDHLVADGVTTNSALDAAFGTGGTHALDVPRPPSGLSPVFPLSNFVEATNGSAANTLSDTSVGRLGGVCTW